MSYTLISETERKARKRHSCIWCPEGIEAGDKYLNEVSIWEGELQDHRWHPECYAAAKEFFRIEGDGEFNPHEFDRGSIHEAGTKAREERLGTP